MLSPLTIRVNTFIKDLKRNASIIGQSNLSDTDKIQRLHTLINQLNDLYNK